MKHKFSMVVTIHEFNLVLVVAYIKKKLGYAMPAELFRRSRNCIIAYDHNSQYTGWIKMIIQMCVIFKARYKLYFSFFGLVHGLFGKQLLGLHVWFGNYWWALLGSLLHAAWCCWSRVITLLWFHWEISQTFTCYNRKRESKFSIELLKLNWFYLYATSWKAKRLKLYNKLY